MISKTLPHKEKKRPRKTYSFKVYYKEDLIMHLSIHIYNTFEVSMSSRCSCVVVFCPINCGLLLTLFTCFIFAGAFCCHCRNRAADFHLPSTRQTKLHYLCRKRMYNQSRCKTKLPQVDKQIPSQRSINDFIHSIQIQFLSD